MVGTGGRNVVEGIKPADVVQFSLSPPLLCINDAQMLIDGLTQAVGKIICDFVRDWRGMTLVFEGILADEVGMPRHEPCGLERVHNGLWLES